MERLTREETIVVRGKEMAACNYENDDCNDSCRYGRCRCQEKANMLLKQYEDTGLTPEQIRELKERDTGVKPMFSDGWDMCGNCGEHLMPDDNFCSECGQKIKWEE